MQSPDNKKRSTSPPQQCARLTSTQCTLLTKKQAGLAPKKELGEGEKRAARNAAFSRERSRSASSRGDPEGRATSSAAGRGMSQSSEFNRPALSAHRFAQLGTAASYCVLANLASPLRRKSHACS